MATVLILDKDFTSQETIYRTALEDSHVLLSADSIDQANSIMRQTQPDLIVINAVLTETVQACSRIRSHAMLLTTPILCITDMTDPVDVAKVLDAGSDDCVRKPCVPRELAARVRAHLRRKRHISTPSPMLTLNDMEKSVRLRDRQVELTPTEYDLLEALCRNPGEHIPASALLEKVWHYPPGVGDPALVRNHVRNLRLKLENDPDRPRIVTSAHGRGYTVSVDIRKI